MGWASLATPTGALTRHEDIDGAAAAIVNAGPLSDLAEVLADLERELSFMPGGRIG